MWVRSDYANELAVLSAWLTVLIPWNVTQHSHEVSMFNAETSILFFRFPFAEFQFRNETITRQPDGGPVIGFDVSDSLAATFPGSNLFGDLYVTWPHTSAQFYDGTLQQASLLWTGAAIMFLLALVFSIVLYFREDAVISRLPVPPARLMGAFLGLGALGTAGASMLYYMERDIVGVPIPVGVLVIGGLAAMLLLTRPATDDNGGQSDDPDLDGTT